MGRMGRTGQSCPFSQLFHFWYDILRSHPVLLANIFKIPLRSQASRM